jgi:hypothetical protein
MSELDIASIWINSMAALATVVASWAALRALTIQTSPDIIMFVRPDDVSPSLARLVIRNIGEAPAYNVAFRLSPELFPKGSFEYTRASVVFDRGYAILPPKQERDILLGEFEDLEDLWGNSIVEVNVSFSKKYARRCFSTVCPVEIGSFESMITISCETAFEKEQRAAYREIRQLGKRLRGIEYALCSLTDRDEE